MSNRIKGLVCKENSKIDGLESCKLGVFTKVCSPGPGEGEAKASGERGGKGKERQNSKCRVVGSISPLSSKHMIPRSVPRL